MNLLTFFRGSAVLSLAALALPACSGVNDEAASSSDIPNADSTSRLDTPHSAEEQLAFFAKEGTVATSTSEAPKAPSYQRFFTGGEMVMLPYDAHVCVIDELRGETSVESTSSGPYLNKTHPDGKWRANGRPTIQLGSTCVTSSSFLVPSGGVRWLSDTGTQALAYWWGTASANLWQGDAFSYLTGFGSSGLGGLGELGQVNQANTGNGRNTLYADADNYFGFAPYAHSFFAGVAGRFNLVRLIGYRNGSLQRGNITTSGTFTFNISNFTGYSSYWMSPADQGFCALTRITGRLAGGSDHVKAYRSSGTQWYATVSSKSQFAASFRCMAYDQRT